MRIFAIFLVPLLSIATTKLSTTPSARSESLRNVHFFKISKNNHSFYLLGSIHIGVTMTDLPSFVIQKLNTSHEIYTELFFGKEEAENYFKSDIQKIVFDPKEELKEISNRDSEKLKNSGVSEKIISWLSYKDSCEKLAYAVAYSDAEFGPGGLDQEIVKARVGQKITLKGKLITIENRGLEDDFFRSMSYKMNQPEDSKKNEVLTIQSCLKKDALKSKISEYKKNLKDLIESYKSGKTEAFHYEDERHRNKGFVNVTIEAHSDNNKAGIQAFVIVGAGHLYGNEGMLELYKKMGFSVKQITR